uniref:NECAP PHear domain-containing protein n=1 Tax=Bicosoecida sp. CB-2014 TaxID=1486930 RepID=A0A7S1CE64_9STRA|mmetsp:Transcript_21682/g.76136  ORF Transcript_21682/g.76136 Transcript_21682/m.76136 type:complete len:279 (+) Transcript_21682:105-941(+)|eukprot:CAMPEP_0203810898 /NCGR_PEP_ID=MMETSP0115-20131106/3226_1 /ASSEMBLY_ACC=CAM_ASM_000227 /TAXON_ID=33651 /ORGANISM="Bicosoecid sp, Strain ms1" /LENGTH=278 /DNA_ID=CAMNT_0050719703 /DNA_START=87 /DNA_END=923 /DNA_ORIENTATION=+
MASAGDEDEFELVAVDECFAFKIPPQSSAAGHKAEDWKTQVWTGSLRVVSKGPHCAIKLVSPDGKLFAVCPVKQPGPPSVEKVVDSSRYFVLRIEDGRGKHAFIGIGFQQRSEAFDFNVGLQDHFKELERERAATAAMSAPDAPVEDFSLKSGETIRISVPKAKARKKDTATAAPIATMGGAGLLAPPPGASLAPPAGGTGRRRRGRGAGGTAATATLAAADAAGSSTAAGPHAASAPPAGDGADLLGIDFGGMALAPAARATGSTDAGATTGDWAPF